MAELQPTDQFLVNRDGVSYNLTTENFMAELLDTDLMLVNRGDVSYKATGLEIKDSIVPKKPPVIGSVTLADDNTSDANRFTSSDFTTTVMMTDPGKAVAQLGIQGKVEGEIAIYPQTSEITQYQATTLVYSNNLSTQSGTYAAGRGPLNAFKAPPDAITQAGTNTTEEYIKWDAEQFNLDTSGGKVTLQVVQGDGSNTLNSMSVQVIGVNGADITSPGTSAAGGKALDDVGILKELYIRGYAGGSPPAFVNISYEGSKLVDGATGPTILTVSSDLDLSKFNTGDAVEQNAGYTPVTDAISTVTPTQIPTIKGYLVSSPAPTDLADLLARGTEVDLMTANTYSFESSGDFIGIITEADTPSSGAVFGAGASGIPDMKFNNGSGNFAADGTRLDAANNPPSGPNAWTDITFSNGGTTGHIVNTQAAYTLVKINASTVPSFGPPCSTNAQKTVTTLTFDSNTNIANFRVGDGVTNSQNSSIATVLELKPADSEMLVDGGTWAIGQTITGPVTTPATGVVGAVDTSAKTITLSTSDVTSPKRWIVNGDRKVNGPITIATVTATTDEITQFNVIGGDSEFPTTTLTSSGNFGQISLPSGSALKSLRLTISAFDGPSYPEMGFSSTPFSGASYKGDMAGFYANQATTGVILVGSPYSVGDAFDPVSSTLVYSDDSSVVNIFADPVLEFVYDSTGEVWIKHQGRICNTGNGLTNGDPATGTSPMFTGLANGHYVGYISRDTATGTINPTQNVLTFSGNKDLTKFSSQDAVSQDAGYTPETSAITNVNDTNPAAVVLTLTDDKDLANFRVSDVLSTGESVTAIGPGNTLTVNGGTWSVGGTVIDSTFPAATGTVAFTDSTANTMALFTSNGRWMVNANRTVLGSQFPATVSMFLVLDENLNVVDLTSTAPDFTDIPQSTTTPRMPPPATIKFGIALPNGQAPDSALPPGTTIQTTIQAVNETGTDTDSSNKVEPTASGVAAIELRSTTTNAETIFRAILDKFDDYAATRTTFRADLKTRLLAASFTAAEIDTLGL